MWGAVATGSGCLEFGREVACGGPGAEWFALAFSGGAASGWLAVRAFDGVCPGSELAGVCVVELEGSTPTCRPTPLSANRSKPDAPAHARVGVFAGDPRPRRNPDLK
jgi:hypothetical protein